MFEALFDIESVDNKILITTGGKQVEDQVKDEALSKSLLSLWEELKIQDIEATE
jgi:hypothetical protein